MAVRHYRELIAWQLATEFKKEVFRLLKSSPEARRNLKFRDQLIDAASSVMANIAEGFRRYSPGEFSRFIDYSVASLGEAEERVQDGIDLGYFKAPDCDTAFRLARRCLTASVRLKHSQRLFTPKKRPKSAR